MGRPAWIGVAVCNDTSGCNKFSWTDGSPVPYANFYSGTPYSPGSCYAMGVPAEGADPGTWVAVPCEGVDRYDCVCLEILEAVRTPCQDGWVGPVKGDLGGEMQGEEACVKVLQNNGNHYKGRDACRQDCLNLKGDLVSIHSARENGLVYGLINAGRPAWIGVAVCNATSGCNEFSWTDGSPTEPYANFNTRSCYAMGVTAVGVDPETWVAVPCEGVDRYD